MPTIDDRMIRQVMEWAGARMTADGTPGLCVAITDRERIIHTGAFGLANIDANEPVTTTHLFETGSIGKSFTAIALLQLADEGTIDLHAPVTDYLPWFSIQSRFAPITLHHLMSHTAGITSGIDFAPAGAIQVWGLREEVAVNPPGAFFHYSNLGYKVLGEVLQAVEGDTYGPIIRRRILDPLGLADSIPTIESKDRHRLAVGYGPLFDDRPWWPGRPLAPATWLETDTGDGCLAMTAADLAIYLRMLINGGAAGDRRILSERAYGLLTQRVIPFSDEPESPWYGYGIATEIKDGRTTIGHGGGMVGYFSSMQADPELGLGVTTVINGPGSPTTIAKTILNALRAAANGESIELPSAADRAVLTNSADFTGSYAVAGSALADRPAAFDIATDGGDLRLTGDGIDLALHPSGDDSFVTQDDAFGRLPLGFDRENGEVVGLIHGEGYWVRQPRSAPVWPEVPEEWLAFPGHYRSHNPWTTSFRVVINRGRLWLLMPGGADGLEDRQPLAPLDDGWFRCGDDPRIPERIRFGAIVNGKALRATLSTCDFYRVNLS
ncbi:MAG: beta-lactamase family protein, partial [Thermomicrobiales bacterium]|nr:beta-lactamase family protein [Thermomicrobiales bacterium]